MGVYLFQPATQNSQARSQQPPIDIDLFLPHALHFAGAALALQVRPHPGQSRQLVFRRRILHL